MFVFYIYICFHCSNSPIMFFKSLLFVGFLWKDIIHHLFFAKYLLFKTNDIHSVPKNCIKCLGKIFVHFIFDNLRMIGITEHNTLAEVFGVYMLVKDNNRKI